MTDEERKRLKENADEYALAWRSLIERCWDQAAVGLLCDLFDYMASADLMTRSCGSTPGETEHFNRWDEARAFHREAAMQILNDQSGDRLTGLILMYREDRKCFGRFASEFARQEIWGPLSGER